MNIVKHSFYCAEELIEFLLHQKYTNYKVNLLLDQAINNYNKTGEWYVDFSLPIYPIGYTFSLSLPGLQLIICQN